MRILNIQTIRQLFNVYDETSNRALDWFIQYLEAQRQGNEGLASYIKTRVLPKVQKESYKSFLCFYEEVKKINGK